MNSIIRRTLHPVTKIIDAALGICEYIASDESVDSYNEIIRADGWRFTRFQKNAPFVDSHNYSSIEKQVGKVIDFKVSGRQLIETVQWAKDVAENKLAQLGWKMTEAGFLKAVSVGFSPLDWITKYDADSSAGKPVWEGQLKDLNLPADTNVRAIYLEQEQYELSACIIGANPNAVAKAFKAGAIGDAELDLISLEHAKRKTANATLEPALVALAQERARQEFLRKLTETINRI